MIRLLRNGFETAKKGKVHNPFSYTLAGIYLGLLFTFFTVFFGENTIPVFFVFTGFVEGYLIAGGDASSSTGLANERQLVQEPAPPRFAVVMA